MDSSVIRGDFFVFVRTPQPLLDWPKDTCISIGCHSLQKWTGRTGTIAGRLMIELGDTADAAINAIRAARPGSIETFEHENAQENYVRCTRVNSDA